MFKISARNFRYQNFIVSASIDLIIENKILLFKEDFSLSDSLPQLLDTLKEENLRTEDSQNERKFPLFICSCGNINCNYFDYKVEHRKNFVCISEIRKKGNNKKFENLFFSIPFKEYAKEIVNLAKELLDFENILRKMISDATFYRYFEKKESIAEKIENLKKIYPEIFEEKKEEFFETLEIEEFLKKVDGKEVVRIIKKFPWKEEELISCLFHPEEVVRYKAAEILGLLKSTLAIPKLIETIIDENEAVRYSALVALSKIGILKNFEFMDELYLRRKFLRGCPKGKIKVENLKESDAILPLISLLKEDNEEILKRTLKTFEKLLPLKDKRVSEAISSFIKDKSKNVELRKEAVILLDKISPVQGIFPLLEILEDKKEDKNLRETVLKIITGKQHYEAQNLIEKISKDEEEDEKIRELCVQSLIKKEFKRKIGNFISPFSRILK
jgi:hypothetical protein